MKKLLLIALILFAYNATASSLPNCPSDQSKRYHNCFGTYTWANGNKYIGEWKDDKRHGQGTYTWANGVEESGYYMNDKFVPTICKNMGLTKGTKSFGQCVVELIKQIRDDD